MTFSKNSFKVDYSKSDYSYIFLYFSLLSCNNKHLIQLILIIYLFFLVREGIRTYNLVIGGKCQLPLNFALAQFSFQFSFFFPFKTSFENYWINYKFGLRSLNLFLLFGFSFILVLIHFQKFQFGSYNLVKFYIVCIFFFAIIILIYIFFSILSVLVEYIKILG